MRNVALIGKARSGKDTAAEYLVRTRAYTRLAFADPLKEMALSVDPWAIEPGLYDYDYGRMRLSEVVRAIGWERAKDDYPEVRRLLQRMGQAQREFDEDYWVNALRRKLNSAEAWNMPVVVTDVRYPNEALMLRARGFRLVRITRGVPELVSGASAHSSETALDDFAADVTLVNDGSIEALHALISAQI